MSSKRADKFLELHKRLETQFRQKLHLSTKPSYYELLDKMIDKGDATVRANREFLRALGDLRNILSHASHGSGDIAEPSEEALEKF